MTGEPFRLMALDGADDDGGTLYVLLDGALPVLSAAWPMPLHQYAADRGRPVAPVAAPGLDYGPDDYDDEREMLADLMAALPKGA